MKNESGTQCTSKSVKIFTEKLNMIKNVKLIMDLTSEEKNEKIWSD